MAQKKIHLELSVVEADHLRAALFLAQTTHEDSFDRRNPALTRIETKLEKAAAAAEPKAPEKDDADDESLD